MGQEMERHTEPRSSRIWGGLILVAAGFLLLAYKMGAPIPDWLFTWPVLLIGLGLLTGIKNKFHNPGSYMLMLLGIIFLLDQSIPGIDLHNYIIPIVLIAIGLLFIFRPKSSACRRSRWHGADPRFPFSKAYMPDSETDPGINPEYIDVHAVFGGIKKNIQSKNFKGGEIVSFMGGSEINFMQADIQHPITLEINNVFGGTKLIIPSNWDVKNEISAVFGGVEDKRNFNNSIPDSTKKILLTGTCVFGGIEITNY